MSKPGKWTSLTLLCCLTFVAVVVWKMDDVDAVLISGSGSLDNVDHADMICF